MGIGTLILSCYLHANYALYYSVASNRVVGLVPDRKLLLAPYLCLVLS